MAHRSPARFLAPLALAAFCIALFMVVQSSQTSSDGNGSPAGATGGAEPTATATAERRGPRRYRVKEGDTPSSIAEETGVPLEQILRLNPDIDPQTLRPGERIRLRQ